MPTVLDVQALPRTNLSRTRRLRDALVEAITLNRDDVVVNTVDLANDHDALPAIDSWDISAKFEVAYGDGTLDEAQATRWDRIVRLTDQLHAASLVVISAPMWNFSIPWHLKRWLDCVMQARLTFDATASGYSGLLEGRPVVLLSTRDASLAEGSGMEGLDFHLPYLRAVCGFMGLGPVHTVLAEGLFDRAKRDEIIERAVTQARELGAELRRSL
jgi:FMN-dependent NADH-azoreductase